MKFKLVQFYATWEIKDETNKRVCGGPAPDTIELQRNLYKRVDAMLKSKNIAELKTALKGYKGTVEWE
jgi:hypothetical protein